ncbi:hypothetical protein ACHABX_06460 [Nesterenkonia halotolerans]|uniref:hypothetical protein n=1 Tax=Nesterenkonia halotolerans TaxID=225325 RepID=UPI003EE7FC13
MTTVLDVRRRAASKLESLCTPAEIHAFAAYEGGAQQDLLMMAFARQCRLLAEARLPHPFTGEETACSHSFSVGERYNVLAFQNLDDPFYVVQRVSFVDALYFPNRDLVLGFRHITDEQLLEIPRMVAEKSDFPEVPRSFAGFIASHHRPYHYFYEIVPALLDHCRALDRVVGARSIEIVQLNGGEYFPLRRILPKHDTYSASSQFLNHFSEVSKCFYVKLGYSGYPDSKIDKSLRRFDRKLIKSLDQPNLLAESVDERLVLAFDISTERGTWSSLEEDIPRIVEAVGHAQQRSVQVYLDGWTLPLSPETKDVKRMKKEVQLGQRISNSFPSSVEVDILVGAPPIFKLRALAGVDAFVARSGTGSMLVSRVLNRPGLVHGNGLSDYDQIHKQGDRVQLLQGDSAAHDEEGRSRRAVSYDLDWKEIVERLNGILSESQSA